MAEAADDCVSAKLSEEEEEAMSVTKSLRARVFFVE